MDLPATSWIQKGDCLGTFMMWIAMCDAGVFSAICIYSEKCKCRPIGNKERKNQWLGDKDKKLFRMWNVKFWMCFAIYYTHSW